MKVKAAKLIGPALNWAVAKCEGKNITLMRNDDGSLFPQPVWADGIQQLDYDSSWNLSGPIIEREELKIFKNAAGANWVAGRERLWPDATGLRCQYKHAPTILVAGLRCFVASRMGDEVDVPDELCRPSDDTA